MRLFGHVQVKGQGKGQGGRQKRKGRLESDDGTAEPQRLVKKARTKVSARAKHSLNVVHWFVVGLRNVQADFPVDQQHKSWLEVHS